jgi:hypothetical protein
MVTLCVCVCGGACVRVCVCGGTGWHTGRLFLMRGADATKDQSYFLSNTTEDALKQTLFPVGHLTKTFVPHACVSCRAVCRVACSCIVPCVVDLCACGDGVFSRE